MTAFGKILVGLIGVLSLAFFILAAAVNQQHINHQQIAADATKKAQDLTQQNNILTKSYGDLQTRYAIEQAARRSAIASLNTQLQKALETLQMQETQLADLQSAHTILSKTHETTSAELTATKDDNDTLRNLIKNTRQDRDQTFTRLVTAKDQLNRYQGQLQTLMERERQLASDYTAAKEKLEILGIEPNTELLASPKVNGEVLLVGRDGLVEVDIGKDDGLRAGQTLEVSRGNQYLGRLLIRRVQDDKSLAEILKDYQKGYIRSGDRVDSQLF